MDPEIVQKGAGGSDFSRVLSVAQTHPGFWEITIALKSLLLRPESLPLGASISLSIKDNRISLYSSRKD